MIIIIHQKRVNIYSNNGSIVHVLNGDYGKWSNDGECETREMRCTCVLNFKFFVTSLKETEKNQFYSARTRVFLILIHTCVK